MKNVLINSSLVYDFIFKNIIKNKAKNLLKDISENMKRMNNSSHVHAEVFLNLVINLDAISHSKTHLLNEFFVENGVDYSIVNNFNGRNETVMVIYNKEKIKKVSPIKAKDVHLNSFEIPFEFIPKNQLKL